MKPSPAEREAERATQVLACPACDGIHIVCRPKSWIDGVPMECGSCGTIVIAKGKASYRDGLIAWNAWCARVLRAREDWT